MNESLLPARYAKALYKFALEKGIEGNIYTAMRNIANVMESHEGNDFRNAIANPFVKNVDKRKLIIAAADIQANESETMSAFNDFLSLLFNNNRIDELKGIVYAYDKIFRTEKNISRVHVEWASEPSQQSEERLKKMVADKLNGGTMEYSSSVNPLLIGGFKIAIDNELLDASVENELRLLRQQILSK